MKIRPVGTELFSAYGRTDLTKLIVIFAVLRERLQRKEIFVTK